MSKIKSPFLSVPALEVSQPFGVFYITKINAGTLLNITFPDPLRVVEGMPTDEYSYPLKGAQRGQKVERLKAIADFIETTEAAFPNSIILGANYTKDGELIEDEDIRWYVEARDSDCLRLVIPTNKQLASIIDGQHRLNGFSHANPQRLSMELLCAVYLDIPSPYQAYIFATINFNQKKVDRSLAYQLFGISINEEDAHTWSPDKMAVFLSRKLNMDPESPFHQHIITAAQNEEILFRNRRPGTKWAVSTATVVDGILKLISSKPQKDKDTMHKKSIEDGRSRIILEDDGTPLRKLYLRTNDLAVYTITKNFFQVVESLFWQSASDRSYIRKTVGIQASFDILFLLMKKIREAREPKLDISIQSFQSYLEPAATINFADSFFQASGKGRTRLKNAMALSLGLITENNLSQNDLHDYLRVTHKL